MSDIALNGVAPYFTMFPLSFPLKTLRAGASAGDIVLDPFCGRGTTGYAARLLGLTSLGLDSSPVAVALAEAKLASASPEAIVDEARLILSEPVGPHDVPRGEFWSLAYEAQVLRDVCCLREALLANCASDARKALRAVVMGALHGPRPRGQPSYFSNQCQRTYAPKPRYAVKFWKARGLRPMPVDTLALVATRAARYYGPTAPRPRGAVALGDSRRPEDLRRLAAGSRARWVITSPPYYGMHTYVPDQWRSHWFVGGPPAVDYRGGEQLGHRSPRAYAAQLRRVWRNVAEVCAPGARLVVRFGGIHDRRADPLSIVKASLADSGWNVTTIRAAGSAAHGKRQSLHFTRGQRPPLEEHDVWAIRTG